MPEFVVNPPSALNLSLQELVTLASVAQKLSLIWEPCEIQHGEAARLSLAFLKEIAAKEWIEY